MSKGKQPKIGGGYGEIRASIDIDKLDEYLQKHLKGFCSPVQVKQFKFGQSNPTYFLTDANGKRYVLRKKPAGELISQTAHQVEREFTMLNALHKHNTSPETPKDKIVPVPEPYLLCRDVSIVGTPFYVMEFLDGRIFTDTRMPGVSAQDKEECWLSAVHALAALGSVNPHEIGLSKFGPSSNYYPRQIKSLSKVSAAQAAVVDIDTKVPVGNIPSYEELIQWYTSHLPDESKLGLRIVHGDYKLDNIVFHRTENRVIGILDWELCTLGSPLADFANLTQPWTIDPKLLPEGSSIKGFKNTTGQAPVDVAILEKAYCQLMGQPYPIKELTFVNSWMLFRLAVIAQGIAARFARRQASSEHAHLYAQNFKILGNLAKLVLQDQGITLRDQPSSKL